MASILPFLPLLLFSTLVLGSWLFFRGSKPFLGASLIILAGMVCLFPLSLKVVGVTEYSASMGQIFVDQSQWALGIQDPLLQGSIQLGHQMAQDLAGSGGSLLWVDLSPFWSGSEGSLPSSLASPDSTFVADLSGTGIEDFLQATEPGPSRTGFEEGEGNQV